jgi:hypothetical protein
VRAFRPARFESVLEIIDGISDREVRGRAVVMLCRKRLPGADDRQKIKGDISAPLNIKDWESEVPEIRQVVVSPMFSNRGC